MSTDSPERYRRIKEAFAEARELAGAQRQDFLDGACLSDAEFRKEVESLLAAEEKLVDDALGRALLEDSEARFDVALPHKIANFRIIGICGSGGMGTVYEAEQDSPRRRVALKVIQASNMREGLLRRFKRETEILGRLQHPGIAQVYDAGEYERDGGRYPYYAMEFIDGDSILEFARRQKLSIDDRVELFRKVCEAMQYAHEHGVVHRDIKPDNVLVHRPHGTTSVTGPSVAQPKILDFGVAQLTDPDLAVTMATGTGQLIGSIPYMSPEQAAADGRTIDHRADVYSLGVLLFEMLAGKLPYDVLHRPLPEAIKKILHGDPDKLGSTDPGLRGDLETMVGKCLEKDADRRYQSVTTLLGDLELYAQHKPITARPPSTWYQISKFAKRHRAVVGGTCATLLASFIGMIIAIVFALRASDNEELANANQAQATRQAYRANLAAANALITTDPLAARRRLDDTPEAERGWEWNYLSTRLAGKLIEFGEVSERAKYGDVEVFADGTRVVSLISPNELGIYDTRSGERVRKLDARRSVITFGIADDGKLLAVGSDDGSVDVMDLSNGEHWETWLAASDERPVVRVDVAPGGKHVAVARGAEILQATREDSRVILMAENLIDRRNDVEYSKDGKWLAALATGNHMREFQIFGVETLETRLPDRFHAAGAMDIAISADGARFAIAHEQRSVTVGETANPSARREFFAHQLNVRSVEFREDGMLLTVSDDRTARIWDLEKGVSTRLISLETLRDAAFTREDTLVTSSSIGLALWRVSEPRSVTLSAIDNYMYDLAFSPSGDLIAASSLNQGSCVLDIHTGRSLFTHTTHTWPIGVLFSEDGEEVFRRGEPNAMYDWASGQDGLLETELPFRMFIHDGSFLLDSRSGSKALVEEFEVWRVEHSAEGARLIIDGQELTIEAATPNQHGVGAHPVLTIGAQGSSQSFDGDLAEFVVFDGHLTEEEALAFETYLAARNRGEDASPPAPSGAARWLAHFRADDGTVEIDEHGYVHAWRDSRDPERVLQAVGSVPWAARLIPASDSAPQYIEMNERTHSTRFLDGPLSELAGKSEVTVFALVRQRDDYGYGSSFYTIGTPRVPFRDVATRRDARVSNIELYGQGGEWYIQGGENTFSQLWVRETKTGALLRTIRGQYHCVALNAVDQRLACGADSGSVDIYDTKTWELIHTIDAHSTRAYAVDWSPDGRRLATGGNDNQIRIWDAESYELLLELGNHDSYVKAVRFSPDGAMLGSASGDYTVRVWDTVAPSVRYARRLDDEERERTVRPQVEAWWDESEDASIVLEHIEATWTRDDPHRHAARIVLALLRSE